MMLAFRRRPTSQKPSSEETPVKASDAPTDSANANPHHLDYDHQPLSVGGLSHYIEPVVDDERFRVH